MPLLEQKNIYFPGNVVYKAALRSQTLLYGMEMKSTNLTNHRRLASHHAKEGFGKINFKRIVCES